MQKISELQLGIPLKKSNKTERGELLKYFAGKLHLTIPRVAFHLTGFKLPDLYYMKSVCDDEERRGNIWAKVFWGSIKPRVDNSKVELNKE